MKLIMFSFLIIPSLCFSKDPYFEGVEQAKNEVIIDIEKKIQQTRSSCKHNNLDNEYYNIQGQLDIYCQLKSHLITEFDKPQWKIPMRGFTY